MRIDDANRWTRTSYSKNYTVSLIYYYIYLYIYTITIYPKILRKLFLYAQFQLSLPFTAHKNPFKNLTNNI